MSSEDIQRTIGKLIEGVEGIRRDFTSFKQEMKDTNKDHSDFHIKMISKFDGFTKQHYQFVEERAKQSEEFATRKINLLENDIKDIKDSHSEEDKDKRRLIFDIIKEGSKVGITAFVAYLTAIFTLNNK